MVVFAGLWVEILTRTRNFHESNLIASAALNDAVNYPPLDTVVFILSTYDVLCERLVIGLTRTLYAVDFRFLIVGHGV